MNETWRQFSISKDLSHHLYLDRPAYHARFLEVQEFRAPGLAPVMDASGAYHVEPDGRAAYAARYLGAFGFYEGRAAVQSASGWYHIMANGAPLYSQRYAWCGNFQDGRSAVRMSDSQYFHLTLDGIPAYPARYRYAGDFRDGYAVVQRDDGMHTHIDSSGAPLHGRWFLDLDVFHKNHARARDTAGWHHVDTRGQPLYERRFQNVEPFYNGQARVEGHDGGLSVIDQTGATIIDLRPPLRSEFDALSADMVGMWRTQTISAAVELGVFESLPASGRQLERSLRIPPSIGARLLSALAELGLVERDARGVFRVSERGAPLARSHPMSLAAAAAHWGRESYTAWGELTRSLRTGESAFERLYGRNFFDWLSDRPADLDSYHNAMSAYARHDYPRLVERLDIPDRAHALDAGGGRGELAFALLRANPTLSATVMDRPEVVGNARVPARPGRPMPLRRRRPLPRLARTRRRGNTRPGPARLARRRRAHYPAPSARCYAGRRPALHRRDGVGRGRARGRPVGPSHVDHDTRGRADAGAVRTPDERRWVRNDRRCGDRSGERGDAWRG